MLRLMIVVLILGVLAATQAARYLVVDDAEKSDAIVVLAGETSRRPERGLELLRQGMAPRLFLDAEAGEQVFDQPLTEIAQRFISSRPEADRMSVCAIEGRSTAAETADVARCLQPLGAHRVLIVTSDYHSRRAVTIFSHRLPQFQWSIAAAHNPAAFGDRWWTHREWAKATFDEWTKLIWWEAVDRWKSVASSQ
ncbi:MAG: YdcF family protein [Terriglobales bacterium]